MILVYKWKPTLEMLAIVMWFARFSGLGLEHEGTSLPTKPRHIAPHELQFPGKH